MGPPATDTVDKQIKARKTNACPQKDSHLSTVQGLCIQESQSYLKLHANAYSLPSCGGQTHQRGCLTPMRVANAFFSKMRPLEKMSKPSKAHSGKSSWPIWKPIRANMLHNLPYVPAISFNQSDHDADPNVLDITIVSKTKI